MFLKQYKCADPPPVECPIIFITDKSLTRLFLFKYSSVFSISIDISYITSKTFDEASVDPVLNIVPLGNSVNIDNPVWSIAITTYPCEAMVSN